MTIAGNGFGNSSGDGGPAVAAGLLPRGMTHDRAGRLVLVDGGAIRRVDRDGTITTIAGPVHPQGPGALERSRLYPSAALAFLADDSFVSVGGFERAVRISDSGVAVVVGYPAASPAAFGRAVFSPLLREARGVAFDPVARHLMITERGTGTLRVIDVDVDDDDVIDDAAAWTSVILETALVGPSGVAHDAATDSFVVADELDHCVRRLDRSGVVVGEVAGRCGNAGVFQGFLKDPTHVVVSTTSGAVYVADTGNHRVLRIDDNGGATTVIGDGSVSSAGEGSPARLFPVNAPRQLALDDSGNLYVASTTTVRLVANVDGDADADADDRVFTIFGGGARDAFPESDTFCLGSLTLDEDGTVFAADACQGFMVQLDPRVD